jgi:hypothetical protein
MRLYGIIASGAAVKELRDYHTMHTTRFFVAPATTLQERRSGLVSDTAAETRLFAGWGPRI